MDISSISIPSEERAAFEEELERKLARAEENRQREIDHQIRGGGRWWMSFIVTQGELGWTNSPSWISGYAANGPTVVMAVIADSEEEAQEQVLAQLREGVEIEWRFAIEKDADFSPGAGGRFPLGEHSLWPGHPTSSMESFLEAYRLSEINSFEYPYRRAQELKAMSFRAVIAEALEDTGLLDEEDQGQALETILEHLLAGEKISPEDAL